MITIQNKDIPKILARVFIRDNTLLEDIHEGKVDITDNKVMKEFMNDIVDNMTALLFIFQNNLLDDFLNSFFINGLIENCCKEYDDPNIEKSLKFLNTILLQSNKKEE